VSYPRPFADVSRWLVTVPSPGRSLRVRRPPRRQVARLSGALTAASAARLLHSLRTASPRPDYVAIDLSAVTSVDRAGANLLLDACVATLLRGGAFALRAPSPTCRRALERFGVLDVVAREPSRRLSLGAPRDPIDPVLGDSRG